MVDISRRYFNSKAGGAAIAGNMFAGKGAHCHPVNLWRLRQ